MMKLPHKISQFFKGRSFLFRASAPGRLDVMGGIADYSGSLVLQMPIREQTTIYLALHKEGVLRAYSESTPHSGFQNEVAVSIDELLNSRKKIEYPAAQARLKQTPGCEWAAYVFGCALVLMKEKGISFSGADFWVDSQVPIGKGVSSSAALETATMTALARAMNLKLGLTELPILAQKVENLIVGAPCGLMDQLACYLGEKGRLLPILCRPDQVAPALDIPQNIHFIGIDSGVRHAVSGASYGDVRVAAFMGYTIIALKEGAKKKDLLQARASGKRSNLPYGGFLTAISPSRFESQYKDLLPVKIRGEEFINQFGATIDPVTQINPQSEYAVRACTAHPIYEHHRVQNFALLLHSLNQDKFSRRQCEDYYGMLGELMMQSHVSYSQCGLGNSVTDEIVEAVQKIGPVGGIYGAKITGGGSGGTVCLLCIGKQGAQSAQAIADGLSKKYHFQSVVFQSGSDGAHKLGVQKLQL